MYSSGILQKSESMKLLLNTYCILCGPSEKEVEPMNVAADSDPYIGVQGFFVLYGKMPHVKIVKTTDTTHMQTMHTCAKNS